MRLPVNFTNLEFDRTVGNASGPKLVITIMSSDLLFESIRSGNTQKVKMLLDANPELVGVKDQRGSTPLLLATYYGVKDMSSVILKFNPEINAQDAAGNTALMGVSFKGYLEIAELLINAGADVNIKNFNQGTALIFAVTFGQKEMIKLLLAHGADPTIKDNTGKTAIEHAANQGFDLLSMS